VRSSWVIAVTFEDPSGVYPSPITGSDRVHAIGRIVESVRRGGSEHAADRGLSR
jgi:hypothetical protein